MVRWFWRVLLILWLRERLWLYTVYIDLQTPRSSALVSIKTDHWSRIRRQERWASLLSQSHMRVSTTVKQREDSHSTAGSQSEVSDDQWWYYCKMIIQDHVTHGQICVFVMFFSLNSFIFSSGHWCVCRIECLLVVLHLTGSAVETQTQERCGAVHHIMNY